MDNLEWYKKIGELQGFEQGAVAQMREINQDGVYTVRTSEKIHKCIVTLTLATENSTLQMDDLNELESKLVLITRKASHWVDEKEQFQEVSA